jgi:sodium/potassium-transporting ATPase subunit alpha
VKDCQYALANFKGSNSKPDGYDRLKIDTYGDYTADQDVVTLQSMQAAWSAGYRPYYPMRARRSHFFNKYWLRWDVSDKNAEGFDPKLVDDVFMSYQPLGVFGITNPSDTKDTVKAPSAAKTAFKDITVNVMAQNSSISATESFTLSQSVYRSGVLVAVASENGKPVCTGDACLLDYRAGFTSVEETSGTTFSNIMSRMMQAKALAVTQTAYFVAIIVSQWANLIVCRTRLLSIVDQGMDNSVLNMGIVFETIVGMAFCYVSFIQDVFRTDAIRVTHWFCAMPFSLFIFAYDETRKFLLRKTSRSYVDKKTGRIFRSKGWLEENTYY